MIEIVNKIFENYENWAAYIDLKNKETDIINIWSSEFKKKLKIIFNDSYPKWKIGFNETKDVFIYPAIRESRKSIELWFEHENKFTFSLWANGTIYNIPKVHKIIKENLFLFEDLISDRLIQSNKDSDPYIFRHELKYNLSKQIGYNSGLLNFFIKDELPREINAFVKPILESEDIFDLIEKLNKDCQLK